MGSMIQTYDLERGGLPGGAASSRHPHDLKGNNDLLRPHAAGRRSRTIHRRLFRRRRSDIVEMNTFSSTSRSRSGGLPPANRLSREINLAAVACARRAAARRPKRPRRAAVCFVAGAIGPLNRTLVDVAGRQSARLPRGDSWEQVVDRVHANKSIALLDGEASTPCWSRRSSIRSMPRPRILRRSRMSSTETRRRRARTGHDQCDDHRRFRPHRSQVRRSSAFYNSDHATPEAVFHRHQLRARRSPPCGRMSRSWPVLPIATCPATPNAGLPNAFGGYDETPADMARRARRVRRQRDWLNHRRRLLRFDARPISPRSPTP